MRVVKHEGPAVCLNDLHAGKPGFKQRLEIARAIVDQVQQECGGDLSVFLCGDTLDSVKRESESGNNMHLLKDSFLHSKGIMPYLIPGNRDYNFDGTEVVSALGCERLSRMSLLQRGDIKLLMTHGWKLPDIDKLFDGNEPNKSQQNMLNALSIVTWYRKLVEDDGAFTIDGDGRAIIQRINGMRLSVVLAEAACVRGACGVVWGHAHRPWWEIHEATNGNQVVSASAGIFTERGKSEHPSAQVIHEDKLMIVEKKSVDKPYEVIHSTFLRESACVSWRRKSFRHLPVLG